MIQNYNNELVPEDGSCICDPADPSRPLRMCPVHGIVQEVEGSAEE